MDLLHGIIQEVGHHYSVDKEFFSRHNIIDYNNSLITNHMLYLQ